MSFVSVKLSVGALAFVAGIAAVQSWRLHSVQGELAELTKAEASARAIVDLQGQAIDRLQVESERLAKAAKTAEKTAAELARRSAQNVQSIQQAPTPDTCEAAIDFLIQDAARSR